MVYAFSLLASQAISLNRGKSLPYEYPGQISHIFNCLFDLKYALNIIWRRILETNSTIEQCVTKPQIALKHIMK